jgi:hypothetical protein
MLQAAGDRRLERHVGDDADETRLAGIDGEKAADRGALVVAGR